MDELIFLARRTRGVVLSRRDASLRAEGWWLTSSAIGSKKRSLRLGQPRRAMMSCHDQPDGEQRKRSAIKVSRREIGEALGETSRSVGARPWTKPSTSTN